MNKAKTPKATLRRKPMAGGRESLYLDFYPAVLHPETGKPSRREFLGRFVWTKPDTQLREKHNEDELMLAELYRQRRQYELGRPDLYVAADKERAAQLERSRQNFVEYFEQMGHGRGSKANQTSWATAAKYLAAFAGHTLPFDNVTVAWCERFKRYLASVNSMKSAGNKLSKNTCVSYFNKLVAALKAAFREGYLQTDIAQKVAPMKGEEGKRSFLSLDELNRLVKTDCQQPILKQAALFSALTGLRFSDIAKLRWCEVRQSAELGAFLQFRQQKTNSEQMLPISTQALAMLGQRGEPDSQVFAGLSYSAYHNRQLYQWLGAAGITRKITFHCFRHTYATLQLSMGTDLYTVSKMLGHKDVTTTQIYAKVVDATKRAAADAIKLAM